MSTPTSTQASDRPAGPPPFPPAPSRRPLRATTTVALMLAPALAAIWSIPWFVTQDGLAHLYNATILVDSLSGGPVFGDYYEVRWDPLPNWGGHAALMALLAASPPRAADKLMTTITMAGVAFSVVWLRRRVAGDRPSLAADATAALAGMSFSWLMGFASFQLGACLFAITLGVWWRDRDSLRAGRMAALAALLSAGYFCHLVSLGLTVLALGFLAIFAPGASGPRSWRDRSVRLGVCSSPLAVLGLVYIGLSRQGGAMTPRLPRADEFLSIIGWIRRLGWVDPISLGIKTALPFTDRTGATFLVFSPILWAAAGAALLLASGLGSPRASARESGERRAWLGLSAVLWLSAILGPESMGPGHGDYLSQRISLLGLVAAVPAIGAPSRSRLGRAGAAAMLVALALQSAGVWDYGLYSDRTAGRIAGAAPRIGRGRRVATLLSDVTTRFRVNPMLHADCWIGVEGNIVWTNYEARHYYFPVHFREGLDRPDSWDLQEIALLGPAAETAERRRLWWERVLDEHHDAIDVLLVWKEAPDLDAVAARWFVPVDRAGDVRIFRPRAAR